MFNKEKKEKEYSGEICQRLGCVACCLGKAYMYLTAIQAQKLRSLGTQIERDFSEGLARSGKSILFKRENDCGALKDNRCSIYDQRPESCRLLEPGSDSCNYFREKNGLPKIDKKGNLINK